MIVDRIDVWAATLLMTFLLNPAFSQDTLQLKHVEVTATRTPSPITEATRHVQVLDSTVLNLSPSPLLSEVLRSHTSLDVRQRSPFDIQTDIGIRGGTFDQSLVLLDGIPLNDPQTGHHTMNTGLFGDALQQVDVLYGAAARTFGAGAFSGAINLRPSMPAENSGRLGVEWGEFSTWSAKGTVNLNKNGKGLRISGMQRPSDGFTDNTDFDALSLNSLIYLPVGKARLKLHGLYDHKRFGALNFYTSAFPDQQEETRMYMGAFELSQQGTWSWSVKGYLRQHQDRFELFRESEDYYTFMDGLFVHQNGDTAPSWYTFHNVHRTRVLGGIGDLRHTWKAGTTSIGVQVRQVELLSNVLGEALDEPLQAAGERESYTKEDGRTNMAVHIDHRARINDLTIDAGILINTNTDYDTEFLPGVDFLYQWNTKHRTFAGVGRGFRLPTYTDLYYNRGGAQGSIDLLPEHNTQMELGHRLQTRTVQHTLAFFVRVGDDLIDWVLLPGDSIVRASNLTELTLSGIEYSGNWSDSLGITSAGWSYAYIHSDRESFDFTSLYVLDQLTHRLSIWGQRRIGTLTVRANIMWQERAGTFVDFSTGLERNYPSNVRVDGRVGYEWHDLELFLSGYNLTDSEQMDRGNVQLPGRWVSIGFNWKW